MLKKRILVSMVMALGLNCGSPAPTPIPPPPPVGNVCMEAEVRPCDGTVLGVCTTGLQTCKEGQWGVECVGNITPTTELCDGLDNDCDGTVDENCACIEGEAQECYGGPEGTSQEGICQYGKQVCDIQGQWGDCVGDVTPKIEVCDGIDNDCNGARDDIPTVVCGVGACTTYVAACQTDPDTGVVTPNVCTPKAPTQEVCDGFDNNCNGLIDENDPHVGDPCDTGKQGRCALGKLACNFGPICIAEYAPKDEVCNGEDDNCDGKVDNGQGVGNWCLTALKGECASGTMQCTKTNQPPECVPNSYGTPEVCDGLDNDCNGVTDDGQLCCPNGQRDGNEGDVDCGGACLAKCTNGSTCHYHSDCDSGSCVDGVCCNDQCGATCKSCNVEGLEGTCSYNPLGTTDSLSCDAVGSVCTGTGQCLLTTGQFCLADSYCLSGKCDLVNKVCLP